MPAVQALRAFAAGAVLAMAAMTALADVQECLVVGVADGDTIAVRCGQPGAYAQIRVRLSGIDAPEKRQPFGTRARAALGSIVFGRMARLECPKTDRYGRKVCSVWVPPVSAPTGPPTLDAGLAMVTMGMAWWYRAYARADASSAGAVRICGAGGTGQEGRLMERPAADCAMELASRGTLRVTMDAIA